MSPSTATMPCPGYAILDRDAAWLSGAPCADCWSRRGGSRDLQ